MSHGRPGHRAGGSGKRSHGRENKVGKVPHLGDSFPPQSHHGGHIAHRQSGDSQRSRQFHRSQSHGLVLLQPLRQAAQQYHRQQLQCSAQTVAQQSTQLIHGRFQQILYPLAQSPVRGHAIILGALQHLVGLREGDIHAAYRQHGQR